MSTCERDTPMLPNPAFSPSGNPSMRAGKKVAMFDMDDAKAPPPIPESMAAAASVIRSGSGFCSSKVARAHGRMSISVVDTMATRPPVESTMKEFVRRNAPPASPASDGSRYSMALYLTFCVSMSFSPPVDDEPRPNVNCVGSRS